MKFLCFVKNLFKKTSKKEQEEKKEVKARPLCQYELDLIAREDSSQKETKSKRKYTKKVKEPEVKVLVQTKKSKEPAVKSKAKVQKKKK